MILPPPVSLPSPTSQRRRRPRPVLTLFGPDPLSQHYASRLDGVYDCVDRLTINAYFPIAQTPGGFLRLAGRSVRLGRQPRQHPPDVPGRLLQPPRPRVEKKDGIPVIHRRAGERSMRSANSTYPPIPHAPGSSASWSTSPRPPSGTCNATATTGSTCAARSLTRTPTTTPFISGMPNGDI